MPRKNAGSTAAADGVENVSILSIDGPKQPSSKPQKDQMQEKPAKKKNDADVVSLDDLLLPRTLINRIARGVLPANTSIQRDAILALTKSATVFISHLAAEANEMTDRKTIQSADVLKALHEIEFAQVMNLGVTGKDGKRGGRIEREIEVWEKNVRGKRRGYRDKVKARDSTTGGGGDTTVGSLLADDDEGDEQGDEHQSKRRKRDSEDEGSGDTSISERRNGRGGDEMDDSEIVDAPTRGKLGARGSSESMGSEEEEDEEDDDQLDDEEGDEQEGTQDLDDSIDPDDVSRRQHGTLAPDGRVEVIGSDDDDDDDSE